MPRLAQLTLLVAAMLLAAPGGAAQANEPTREPPSAIDLDLDLLGSSAWNANATLASRAGDNLRWAMDGSLRLGWSTGKSEWTNVEAIGLDAFTVVPGKTRDLLRVNLQLYAVRIDVGQSHPWAFDGEGRWRFQPRNSFVDALLLPREKLTWRIGHYELPWGIETRIDTNGTLRQYNLARDLGIKTDWGTALTGRLGRSNRGSIFGALEWVASLSRGSGNSWHGGEDPWLALGRLATAGDQQGGIGLGVAGGDVRVGGRAPARPRWRVVLDGYYTWRAFEILGEVSGGRDGAIGEAGDGDSAHITAILETDVNLLENSLLGYFQFLPAWERRSGKGSMNLELRSGFLWRVLPGLSLSAEIRQIAAAPDDAGHPTSLFAQIRYRRGGA